MRVLIVEDEVRLAATLQDLLEINGYTADVCHDGESGLDNALSGIYDVILLDVMLPKMDGFTLLRHLRGANNATPVLMLTARDQVGDRVEGLDCGADYYLTKPFDMRELLACINALLRRQGGQVDEVTFGNTALDLSSATLICTPNSIPLSSKEFDIMRALLQSGGRNLTKEVLLARVWGYDSDAVENNVEVYIGFLRKKLASIGSNIRIVARRRLGYHLEVGEDDSEAAL